MILLGMKDPRIELKIASESLVNRSESLLYKFAKRTIDVVGSCTGLIILMLVMLPCSLFYLVGTNKGPVFFKQKRCGQKGDIFEIYKFRSMILDAEDLLRKDELLYRKYVLNNYKIEVEEDPRITSFGRFIRKTSLDEIPQFINVLKGEMSLVGPRPLVEAELEQYQERKDLLLSVKPGMTGYWQVCGRSDVKYPERAEIELYYIQHQSISLDIEILFKTVVQVVKRTGAY